MYRITSLLTGRSTTTSDLTRRKRNGAIAECRSDFTVESKKRENDTNTYTVLCLPFMLEYLCKNSSECDSGNISAATKDSKE